MNSGGDLLLALIKPSTLRHLYFFTNHSSCPLREQKLKYHLNIVYLDFTVVSKHILNFCRNCTCETVLGLNIPSEPFVRNYFEENISEYLLEFFMSIYIYLFILLDTIF